MSRWGARLVRLGEVVALLSWTILTVWTFSYAYSDSFFRYNLHSRLPPFLAAVLAALAIPVSGYVQFRRMRRDRATPIAALVSHVLVTAAALAPLLVVAAVLNRAPAPWHMSADDAMGVGIDWLLLLGLAILSVAVLAVALVGGRRRSRARARLPHGRVRETFPPRARS